MENKNIHEYLKYKLQINDHDNPPLRGKLKTSRDDLAVIFADLNYTVGAEIGVRKGYYSDILLKCNPRLTLYGVDPYLPYSENMSKRKQKTYLTIANNILAPYGNKSVLIIKNSIDAAKDFSDGSLDFVYIDADHDFDNVMTDILTWQRKVKSGGIISGHDYDNSKYGIIKAVNIFAEENKMCLYLTNEGVFPSWFLIQK